MQGNLIAGLTVMDDILMRNVLNQTECTEYVLQTIMGQKELKVLECVVQKDYKNLQGRSAILDCVARDAEDRGMMWRSRMMGMRRPHRGRGITAV